MSIRTTNGESFSRDEHRLLAMLMFKRFGRNKASFCAAWRRMMENDAEDHEILRLLDIDLRRDQESLRETLLREGNADARYVRVEGLDGQSCRILNRLILDVRTQGEMNGQRNIGRAIARGMIRY